MTKKFAERTRLNLSEVNKEKEASTTFSNERPLSG